MVLEQVKFLTARLAACPLSNDMMGIRLLLRNPKLICLALARLHDSKGCFQGVYRRLTPCNRAEQIR
jgi:hypothetical protein